MQACTHENLAELSLWQISEPYFPSPEFIYWHTFSIHATHLSCLQRITQFCSSFCFSFYVSPSLFFSHCLSALWSACHYSTCSPTYGAGRRDVHRTVIPTIDMACHCPAGSGLQYSTHTGFKDTHPGRMARKLDWHLNNRITGAYDLSINTVSA